MEDDQETRDPGLATRWRPPGWTAGRALPIVVGVAGGLVLAQITTAVFVQLRGLLLIVLVSLFLSFALDPAVGSLARRGIRRGLGTGLVFLAGFLLFAAFIAAMSGLVVDQVRTLIDAGPTLLGDLASQADRLPRGIGEPVSTWLDEQQQALPDRLADAAGALGRGFLGFGQIVLGGLFQLATVGLVTFYLVADGPRLRFRLASRLPPRQQVHVLGVWELAIAKTGGYVYSRLLTAIASTAFHVAAFTIIGLDYPIALGVWVGIISSLIPAVGTYLAGALPLVVALASGPSQAIWVLIAVTVYQQVENYLVVPRITASTLELHPAVAFLSVLAGGVLAGATGALLAIPAVAIVTALASAAAEQHDVLEHHLVSSGRQAVVDLVHHAEAARAEPGVRVDAEPDLPVETEPGLTVESGLTVDAEPGQPVGSDPPVTNELSHRDPPLPEHGRRDGTDREGSARDVEHPEPER